MTQNTFNPETGMKPSVQKAFIEAVENYNYGPKSFYLFQAIIQVVRTNIEEFIYHQNNSTQVNYNPELHYLFSMVDQNKHELLQQQIESLAYGSPLIFNLLQEAAKDHFAEINTTENNPVRSESVNFFNPEI
ncbi:MAG: hypothetical protein OHK0017_11200 [Patescibacteria group bacterium]